MLLVRTALSAVFLASLPLWGSELVHLATGFDVAAQSHILSGSTFTLRTNTGTIEIPGDEVLGIDVLSEPPQQLKPATNLPPADPLSLIASAAATQASTPEFIHFVQCVAQVESALRQNARSAKGATGLMQLMPGTAKDLGVVATDAEENARGGAKYLRDLLIRYHNDSVLALAAYNAGPGAVQKYRGVPPYLETRRYIEKVLREYSRLQSPGAAQTSKQYP